VIYLQTLLQSNGYDTVSASDESEGMEKMRSAMPDLITPPGDRRESLL
jgi:CheY-like chemotaxis protein